MSTENNGYKYIAELRENEQNEIYNITRVKADSEEAKEFCPVEQMSGRNLLKIEMYDSLKDMLKDPAFKDILERIKMDDVNFTLVDVDTTDIALTKEGLLPVRGLSQYLHGAEKRFLIKEDVLNQEMFNGEGIPEETGVYDMLYPIGGSNSSGTEITESFETTGDILSFLTRDCEPDLEDPELVDLAECYLEYPDDGLYCDSCTDEILRVLKVDKEDLVESVNSPKYEEAKAIIGELQSREEDLGGMIDLDNPWYGNSRDVRFNDLTDAYEAFKKENDGPELE